MKLPSQYSIVILAIITIYFLAFAWPGFQTGLGFDDLLNLYKAERLSWSGHIIDTVVFAKFSSVYRPIGSLWYRIIFELFGFQALPFRIAMMALMVVNIILGFALARKLTGSRESAALGILLFAFHGRLNAFFDNTGYIYDLLCFTFFIAAFLYYVSTPRPNLFIWGGLYLLCLDSKEMAVSLPLLIGAWEVMRRDRAKTWWYVPVLGAAMTILFIGGRLYAPAEGLAGVGHYRPDPSLANFLAHAQAHLSNVAYNTKWLTPMKSAVLFAFGVVITILTRNRVLALGLLWMVIAVLPIAFIMQRPLAAAYLPFFGLTLFLGEFVWQTTWQLAKHIPAMTPPRWGVASFAALLLLMALVHRKHGRDWLGLTPEHIHIAHVAQEMRHWQPRLSRGEKTLFLADPFPTWDWDSVFLAGIIARNPALKDRREIDDMPSYQQGKLLYYFKPTDTPAFDLALAWDKDHFNECDRTPLVNKPASELATAVCVPIQSKTYASQR